MGKMETVSAEVGGVNSKFNATRFLLLIGQGQQVVLTAVTTSNPMYDQVIRVIHKLSPTLAGLEWHFSNYQALLLNSSLLCYECLLVVIANYFVWKDAVRDKELAIAPKAGGAKEPLL